MSRLRKAVRAALTVQAFNVAGTLLSLISVPLYLTWLGQERYGLLLTGLAFSGYLMFADAGLSWSSMLLISQANGREDLAEISAIVRNSISLACVSALLVAVVVFAAIHLMTASWMPTWLPHHPEASGLALAVGLSVITSLLISTFYNLFDGLQEMYVASTYQGIGRLTGTLAALVAAWAGEPLGIVFGANVLCAMAFGIVAAIHCMRRHPWAFSRGPIWERDRIRAQLRCGGKSFGMQIGSVLVGTAPVFAVSFQAGAAAVPYLTIPLTLLNFPLNLMTSFNMTLQPGYGEAMGKNEKHWVASTINGILHSGLVFIGVLIAGFIVLTQPVVHLWTGGRLEIPLTMVAGALLIAVTGALLNIFRFALTGTNRHRIAAISELVNGVLSFVLAVLIVRYVGFAGVGFAVFAAALLTSYWILPHELRRNLQVRSIWPSLTFWVHWMASVCIATLLGELSFKWLGPVHPLVAIGVTMLVITAAYAVALRVLLPKEWEKVSNLVEALRKRFLPTASSESESGSLRILVIVDPHITVPPSDYGGTERVAALLCDGWRKQGHEIRLMAKEESLDYGAGLWTHRAPTRSYVSRAFRKILFQFLSLHAARGMDVVVNFGRVDYMEAILRTRIPVLHCCQNPIKQDEFDWLLRRRNERIRFVAASRDQAAGLQPFDLIDVVHNAVDTHALQPPADDNRSYLAFLGRVTSNKGADTAIEVARRTGMKLKLAGNISTEAGGQEFFETQIRPQLGADIEYVGPVDDEAKNELLSGASALLFPIRWSEPFGLVMAEALACGTPVIAARRASAPEVIEHGKTGFLCDSEDDMVAAVARLTEIDRVSCRRAAEGKFSPERLAQSYLESIRRVIGTASLSVV